MPLETVISIGVPPDSTNQNTALVADRPGRISPAVTPPVTAIVASSPRCRDENLDIESYAGAAALKATPGARRPQAAGTASSSRRTTASRRGRESRGVVSPAPKAVRTRLSKFGAYALSSNSDRGLRFAPTRKETKPREFGHDVACFHQMCASQSKHCRRIRTRPLRPALKAGCKNSEKVLKSGGMPALCGLGP